ncbi:MAG: STAS domain-containing protein [Campylobacter sp.]
MKVNFKDEIVVFSPFGFLDGDASKYEIDKFQKDLIIAKRFECLLISFKKVVHFNRLGLNLILQTVTDLARKIQANVAFCDYNEAKFKALKDVPTQNIGFSLFETQEIASLFFSKNIGEKSQTPVIIYSENSEQRNQMALKLAERGFMAHIAKDIKIFQANKDQYKYQISLSQINLHERNITMQVRENVVIYKLNGFIDSNFAENFDMIMHTNSLRVGFRFFAFDATKARSANIHGVSFLSKLSTASAEFGATIAVCGLSANTTSQTLRDDLEDAGLLLYDSVDDFFNDETSIIGGAGMLEIKPRNITKNLIEILPLIIKIAVDTIYSISNIKIERGSVNIKNFDLKRQDGVNASIAFYGDFEMKITLSLQRQIAQKACLILIKNDENITLEQAYANLILIIANKIVSWFESKKININMTMPHVFDLNSWTDSVSKGAFVELNAQEPCGILFINR